MPIYRFRTYEIYTHAREVEADSPAEAYAGLCDGTLKDLASDAEPEHVDACSDLGMSREALDEEVMEELDLLDLSADWGVPGLASDIEQTQDRAGDAANG